MKAEFLPPDYEGRVLPPSLAAVLPAVLPARPRRNKSNLNPESERNYERAGRRVWALMAAVGGGAVGVSSGCSEINESRQPYIYQQQLHHSRVGRFYSTHANEGNGRRM